MITAIGSSPYMAHAVTTVTGLSTTTIVVSLIALAIIIGVGLYLYNFYNPQQVSTQIPQSVQVPQTVPSAIATINSEQTVSFPQNLEEALGTNKPLMRRLFERVGSVQKLSATNQIEWKRGYLDEFGDNFFEIQKLPPNARYPVMWGIDSDVQKMAQNSGWDPDSEQYPFIALMCAITSKQDSMQNIHYKTLLLQRWIDRDKIALKWVNLEEGDPVASALETVNEKLNFNDDDANPAFDLLKRLLQEKTVSSNSVQISLVDESLLRKPDFGRAPSAAATV